ncbi:YqhR family membrane protein [Peribacillus sp. SCS-155]|uniref:YqhR family membrane protein n=1 Tax=Peribacillus sedimenti TaxID=3115297 RepID=UPI003905E063
MSQKLKNSQNGGEINRSLFKDSIIIGFFGGLIWSFIAQVAYYFNFMSVGPKFILTSWTRAGWVEGWLGLAISLLIFAGLSIIAALVYCLLFKKIKTIIAGMVYGLALWLLLLFVIRPIFSDLPSYAHLNATSIITSVCIFIIYGVFVGYTISYENKEIEESKRNKQSSAQGSTP